MNITFAKKTTSNVIFMTNILSEIFNKKYLLIEQIQDYGEFQKNTPSIVYAVTEHSYPPRIHVQHVVDLTSGKGRQGS